jgi:hypothetical protein
MFAPRYDLNASVTQKTRQSLPMGERVADCVGKALRHLTDDRADRNARFAAGPPDVQPQFAAGVDALGR